MAKVVGIDIRSRCVRAAVLSASYRRVFVESLVEVNIADYASLSEAVRACGAALVQHSESMACAFTGEASYIHRVSIPATAAKRVNEVLPFELEAQMPVDFQDLVYDYREVAQTKQSITLLAAAARIDDVQDRILLLEEATGHEPERVGVAGIPLVNLVPYAPVLALPGPIAVVDIGDRRSELLLIEKGQPVFVRTISVGVEGLPEAATELAAALRQSFAAWSLSGGTPVVAAYLCGTGAEAVGAEAYLAEELGVPVNQLNAFTFSGVSEGLEANLGRFAKAIGLALSLRGSGNDLNLRKGELTYERGYGFLKEKIPLLAGLAVAVFVSFLFSAWAERRALIQEHEVLSANLDKISKQVFGEATSDPDRIAALFDEVNSQLEKDPQPELDAFDVMVKFAESVPEEITHDIEEFDVQRTHVKIRGIVGSTEEAENVANSLKENRCYDGAKISKLTQKVNSERQKYLLEFDLRCEDEKSKNKKAGEDKAAEKPQAETEAP